MPSKKHYEPGVVDLDDSLTNWPLQPVPRHLIADEAHHHAVEFKKQSGAAPEQIDDLMRRHGAGLDIDKYFEKKLEAIELDWEDGPPKSDVSIPRSSQEPKTFVAYIHGLTSSDRSAPDPVLDIAIVDIGETETVAMMDVRIPTMGDRPLKQFLHSEMLKFLTDDARSQAIKAGKIELRNGHSDAELKDALIKSSEVEDSLSGGPRHVAL